jgi:small subunit ribosomal protein S16
LYEIGCYDPQKDHTHLNVPKIIQLLKQGAKPTDTVNHLLHKAGIFEQMMNLL